MERCDFSVTNQHKSMSMQITQRNTRGGAIGDVVILHPSETAEIMLETDGVQLTVIGMPNVQPQEETVPPEQTVDPEPEA